MSVNPFVSRKPTDSNKPNLMDDFFSKPGPLTIISLDPSRKGKITPKVFIQPHH